MAVYGLRHKVLQWPSSEITGHAHKTVYPDKMKSHEKEVRRYCSLTQEILDYLFVQCGVLVFLGIDEQHVVFYFSLSLSLVLHI